MHRSREAPTAAHALVKFQVRKDVAFSSGHVAPGLTQALDIGAPPHWLRQAIQQVIIGGQPAAANTTAGKNLGSWASAPNLGDARTARTNLRGMLPF
jgi:hypothetical protein